MKRLTDEQLDDAQRLIDLVERRQGMHDGETSTELLKIVPQLLAEVRQLRPKQLDLFTTKERP